MAHWTKHEEQILRANYGVCRVIEILPLLPGRTISGCRKRASQLGLKGFDPRKNHVTKIRAAPVAPPPPPPKPPVSMASLSGRGNETVRLVEEFMRADGFTLHRNQSYIPGTNAIYRLILPDGVTEIFTNEPELLERAKRREAAILRQQIGASPFASASEVADLIIASCSAPTPHGQENAPRRQNLDRRPAAGLRANTVSIGA